MEFIDVITNRHSCRAFTGEKISETELKTILQAANAAPVGMGNYADVKLTVIENKELLEKLEAHTCKAIPGMTPNPIYGAATVIAIHCKKEESPAMAMANASTIAENMLLTATDLGLGSIYLMAVPGAAQYSPELCAEMKVPEGFAPYVMVGVGKAKAEPQERQLTLEHIQTEYVR